jgi:putative peptide zinc metalloprotease protein
MNLARILEQSADDLPQVRMELGPPRLHPKLVVKEHHERDGSYYTALIPGGRPPHYFRFNEKQWRVCSLFNGQRTVEQVAKLADAKWGIHLRAADAQALVDILAKDGFWYRTPQEESVALCQHLMQERNRKVKREDHGDLSHIVLASFDPDNLLNWINKHFSWVYSRWFTVWSIVMLFVMVGILGSHWNQVWADSVNYYRLTGRGFIHFLHFLGIFVILGFVHESAHGLTCKHFGGAVHRMGANLVYLAPCVFCDVSQVWVYGERRERMLTVFAGVWSEIVLCTYASVIWWATPPGTFLHDAAYLTILSGGIFCVMLNWNPLAKMDGYMLMTEFFRIRDVKVVATTWLLAWLRKHVFHLPARVENISLVRAVLYSIYAVLAGMYSYFLLLFFVRVTYHIVSFYTPQWAFIPAGLLALKIFRTRIRKFGTFMKELYLDKKDLLRAHRPYVIAGTLAVFVFLCVPIFRDTVKERFVLEPRERAVLRAQVPGLVTSIGVREGDSVQAGAVLATLRDASIESQLVQATAEVKQAESRSLEAQLRYADFAPAEELLRRARADYAIAAQKRQQFNVTSPLSGIVVTPRVQDLLDTYVKEGTVIGEVADTSTVRARIFVPEHEFHKLGGLHDVVLRMDSHWHSTPARVLSISPSSQPPDPGMFADSAYKGVKLPEFFIVTVEAQNEGGTLRDGMTGLAKIRCRRRSLLATALEPLTNAIARRFW